MGLDQKALLAELDKRFAAQEMRFDGLEKKFDSTVAKLDSTRRPLLPVWMPWSPQPRCSTNGTLVSTASSMTFVSKSTSAQH
jgi:hypothetical protein